MSTVKTVNAGVEVIKESVALRALSIAPGASLAAPEGKSLTMTVDGVGTVIKPGTYKGDIALTVTDRLLIQPGGLMRRAKPKEYRTAILVEDGKYVRKKSVPAIVQGGKVTDKATTGITIYGCEDDFNGIIVKGDSEYTIDGVKIDFEGNGTNDFIGYGAGIMCIDNAKVTVNNSEIKLKGVYRCTFHAGGNSVTTLNNCRLSNESPVASKMMESWQLGMNTGTNRATQCCDYATVYYNNCHISGNGWGVLSIDGGVRPRIYVKDSTIELTGPRARGYGSFAIGETTITYDHCTVNVQGYPLLMGGSSGFGEESNGEITGGSVINSTLYGALIFRAIGGFKVDKGATLNSASSTFVVKGANVTLNVDNAVLNPGNGVILQLMDDDDPGMAPSRFIPPIGADLPIPGCDLTVANPKEDVFMNVSNMEVKGDFYNSTTDLRANCIEKIPMPSMPDMDAEGMKIDNEAQQGVKNLDLKFAKAKVSGIISAAKAAYKEDVVVIDASNCKEISAVTQTAHEPVNNGVIVSFDKDSVWTVAGTSYLTSLTVAKGAVIKAPKGKTLTMTVNGTKKPITAGTYRGKIVLTVTANKK
jgi:uncharacterized Zn-binding protein involved in type VI secretion